VVGAGPVQRSHVFNLEANYDLTDRWTIGGKLGYRITRSAPEKDQPFTDNGAMLAIVNARYELPKKWDFLIEARHFKAFDTDFSETGVLAAAYKHINENVKVGVGYNFGSFSDDLTDLVRDDEGVFINIIAKF